MNRAGLVSLIHTGKTRLGWDEATYRAWLVKHTGKSSTKDCRDHELMVLADAMRRTGALEKPGSAASRRSVLPGGAGYDRPSPAQWEEARRRAEELGWTGEPNDPRLVRLARRTAKVDHTRFLDRKGMSDLLNALGAMVGRKRLAPTN